MQDRVTYSARPQLRDVRRFMGGAVADLMLGASLARSLFQSSLQSQMRRSLLGYLWLFIPAAVAALAVSYVQASRILSLPDTGMPLPVFVFGGMVLWQLFLESLNSPSRQFAIHRITVTRMKVPHEALVLAGVFEAVLNAAARLLALLALCWATGAQIGPAALLAIPAAAMLVVLGVAAGLFLAPLTLLFEDGARGVMLATNLLVFAMPVFYPVPVTGFQRFNLLVPLIDTPRSLLVGMPAHQGFALAAALSIALLLVAWPFYRLARLHIVARMG